jgi:hypothetical protein
MANRTQIVCLHEGIKGRSIDPVFINALIKALDPSWLRPYKGSNLMRRIDCGGRKELIKAMPGELRACLNAGADTTLIVWADVDDDKDNCDQLKEEFWKTAQAEGISIEEFSQVVFAFAKDRLENWIQYLNTGSTDESVEGPRVKYDRQAADAAKILAKRCLNQTQEPPLPPSLDWSCRNWKSLVSRMKKN